MTAYTTSGSQTNISIVKDGITVTLQTTQITENFTKALININPPKTFTNQKHDGDVNNLTYGNTVIDILNKVEWRVTVNGMITGTDADTQRSQLRYMFLDGGAVTITASGYSAKSAFIDKLEIKTITNDNIIGDDLATYDVVISLIIGEARTV